MLCSIQYISWRVASLDNDCVTVTLMFQTLLEANRYLLRHLDAANLKPPADVISPELRAYTHLQMVGLFLFNDALVVTQRTTRNVPFSRCVEYSYVFEACSGLQRLRVEDIPDSKCKTSARLYAHKLFPS